MAAALLGGRAAGQDEVLKAVFARYDADKDGVVTAAEFPGSEEQFAAMDRDRNGKVTLAEFAASAVARRILAARNRDAGAPRERADADAGRALSLQWLARFDRNRDGAVTRPEWNGSPVAFAELDLDRDGKLDGADRKLAERRVAESRKGTYDDLRLKSPLPDAESIFRRHDKDRDQLLTRREVAGGRLAALFPLADTNRDELLDLDEVQVMIREVAARVYRRNQGYQRPRAYIVPFATWDENNDGRLDTGEWLERKYLFPRIDVNRDGAVTKEEVSRYKLSVEGRSFVEKFDLDGDGRVTLREFAGSRDAFRRADRNGDGVVSGADR